MIAFKRHIRETPYLCVGAALPPCSGKLLPGLSPLSFLSLLSRASLPFSHKPFSEGKSPHLVSAILASCPSFPNPFLINPILQRALYFSSRPRVVGRACGIGHSLPSASRDSTQRPLIPLGASQLTETPFSLCFPLACIFPAASVSSLSGCWQFPSQSICYPWMVFFSVLCGYDS